MPMMSPRPILTYILTFLCGAHSQDDMQRGYFDDFREFRDSQGKVFQSPQHLISPSVAPIFPTIHPFAADGSPHQFPPSFAAEDSAPPLAVSLVCVAYRAGAQEMLEAWAAPFSRLYRNTPRAALFEIALVESVVMGLWPFRNMLMKNGASSQGKYSMPATYLYQFKDAEGIGKTLHMTNRLTGYIFLLDGQGRVRWRGSGNPDSKELKLLEKCSEKLLKEVDDAHTSRSGEAETS